MSVEENELKFIIKVELKVTFTVYSSCFDPVKCPKVRSDFCCLKSLFFFKHFKPNVV